MASTAAAPALAARASYAGAAVRTRAAVRASAVSQSTSALFKKAAPGPAPKKVAPKSRTQVVRPGVGPKEYLGLQTDKGKKFFGFSKANELFVGRLAMLGFASSLIGEVLTGKGPLEQFDIETGIPLTDSEPAVLGLIAFNLLGALIPAQGKLVLNAETDLDATAGRRAGSLQDPKKSLLNPADFLGLNKNQVFGFTKENEIFVGRMAQLGFAASLIGEAVTGKGALAQFDLETGLPLSETEPLLLAFIAFFALAAVYEGKGEFVDEE